VDLTDEQAQQRIERGAERAQAGSGAGQTRRQECLDVPAGEGRLARRKGDGGARQCGPVEPSHASDEPRAERLRCLERLTQHRMHAVPPDRPRSPGYL
jgi:hypothetical protein